MSVIEANQIQITPIPATIIPQPPTVAFAPQPRVKIDPALYVGISIAAAVIEIAKLHRRIERAKTQEHRDNLRRDLKAAGKVFDDLHAAAFVPRVLSRGKDRAQVVIVWGDKSYTRYLRLQGGKWTGKNLLGNRVVEYRVGD